jgi:aspartate aminotransferase-like enzyme
MREVEGLQLLGAATEPSAEKLPFRIGPYTFKIATEPQELEAVYRLNYRTFVQEIRQHHDPGTDYLIDKFDEKNVYFVAKREERVVGMVAAHDKPPFSIASRLPDPSLLERPGMVPLEVRLLAVEPGERHGLVFAGLVWSVYIYAREEGYTNLFISGVVDRQSLYERLGFKPLGPAVRSGEASFVPMMVDLTDLPPHVLKDMVRWRSRLERINAQEGPPRCVRLLAGPVAVAPEVAAAWSAAPLYHRSPEFIELYEEIRQQLADLVRCPHVALLGGSGTLANEAVAACLAADPEPGEGLILSNGEFGDRLVQQASRFGLLFQTLRWPWGKSWDLQQVVETLQRRPSVRWIWCVHLETSTGVLNDLPALVEALRGRGVRLCVDCVSSIGAVDLDLSSVYAATGVSGKSLGSFAGLAIVFASEELLRRVRRDRLPCYLDVPAHVECRGPRFTIPSTLLTALNQALRPYRSHPSRMARYRHYAELGQEVRTSLRELGIDPLADETYAAPVITTFHVPDGSSSEEFVRRCRRWGFEIGGISRYLADRGLVQIATMGCVSRVDLRRFFEDLGCWLGKAAPAVRALAKAQHANGPKGG